MASVPTPPLFLHLHEYAAETAAAIAYLENVRGYQAGELIGALVARALPALEAPAVVGAAA